MRRPGPSSSSSAPVRRPGGLPHGFLPPHLRNPPFGPPQWGPLPPHPVTDYGPPTPEQIRDRQDIFVTDMELRDEIFEIRENLINLSLNQVRQGLNRYWTSAAAINSQDQDLFIQELEKEQIWANTAITDLLQDLLKEKKRRIHMQNYLGRQMVPLVSIQREVESMKLRIHHKKLQIECERQVQLEVRKRGEYLRKKLQSLAIEIEKLRVEAQGV